MYLLASSRSSGTEFEVVPIRCIVPATLRYIFPLLRTYTSALKSVDRYLLDFIVSILGFIRITVEV